MYANLSKDACATSIVYQFGCPVACGHQRVEPFQHCDTGTSLFCAQTLCSLAQTVETLLITVDQVLCQFGAPKRLPNTQHIFPHVTEPIRCQRDDARMQSRHLLQG